MFLVALLDTLRIMLKRAWPFLAFLFCLAAAAEPRRCKNDTDCLGRQYCRGTLCSATLPGGSDCVRDKQCVLRECLPDTKKCRSFLSANMLTGIGIIVLCLLLVVFVGCCVWFDSDYNKITTARSS